MKERVMWRVGRREERRIEEDRGMRERVPKGWWVPIRPEDVDDEDWRLFLEWKIGRDVVNLKARARLRRVFERVRWRESDRGMGG